MSAKRSVAIFSNLSIGPVSGTAALCGYAFLLGLVSCSAAFAADVEKTTVIESTTSTTSTAAPVAPAVPSAPAATSVAAPAVPEASSAPAAATDRLVEIGPLEAQRTALVMRIFKAKEQGIGTDAYLNAFAMLENSVKTGETEANLAKRIASLNSSLDDQLKRSALLKIQKPAPPVAASGFPAAGGGPSSGGSTSDLIKRLQEKYGGQIPADLKEKYGGQIPDSLKDKLPGLGNMDPGQIEELIKKYKK
jgi:hypothetical protein